MACGGFREFRENEEEGLCSVEEEDPLIDVRPLDFNGGSDLVDSGGEEMLIGLPLSGGPRRSIGRDGYDRQSRRWWLESSSEF